METQAATVWSSRRCTMMRQSTAELSADFGGQRRTKSVWYAAGSHPAGSGTLVSVSAANASCSGTTLLRCNYRFYVLASNRSPPPRWRSPCVPIQTQFRDTLKLTATNDINPSCSRIVAVEIAAAPPPRPRRRRRWANRVLDARFVGLDGAGACQRAATRLLQSASELLTNAM